MNDIEMTIGHVARAAGCKVQTVRYYEDIGLTPPARRSAGNQRVYGPSDRDRLVFIRRARELGFPIEAIRELLGLVDSPDRSCEAVDVIARGQLAAVEQRLTRLAALKHELETMIAQCSGGRVAQCRVIEALGGGEV